MMLMTLARYAQQKIEKPAAMRVSFSGLAKSLQTTIVRKLISSENVSTPLYLNHQ